jgi:hypothetical protein
MGTGRSGTTILQVLLGQAPGTCAAGELSHIFRDGFLEDARCACGRRTSECTFWAAVREELPGSEREMELRDRLVRSVEWHTAFPALAAGLVPARRWCSYCELQRRLLRAIGRASRARTIVDDSIYPGRALALDRCLPGRVAVICLLRSPGGLQSAFSRPNPDEQRPKSAIGALAYYAWVALSVRVVLWRFRGPVLRLTYEELRCDPEGVMRRIEAWSGLDLGEVRRRLQADESFPIGHVVTGNRMRERGVVRFQRGLEPLRLPLARWLASQLMEAVRWLLRL